MTDPTDTPTPARRGRKPSGTAKPGAARQAAYRERHGLRPLDLPADAVAALRAEAARRGEAPGAVLALALRALAAPPPAEGGLVVALGGLVEAWEARLGSRDGPRVALAAELLRDLAPLLVEARAARDAAVRAEGAAPFPGWPK